MYKKNINIADLVFSLNTPLPAGAFQWEESYSGFFCSGDPGISVRGHYSGVPGHDLDSDNRVFESGLFWDIHNIGGRFAIALKRPGSGNPVHCLALFDAGFDYGDVYHSDPYPGRTAEGLLPQPLAFPLFHLLMISRLAQGLGLLVHASGVDDNGRGYLFPGRSTYGKTTMARLWKGQGVILNDERVVLRKRGRRFWIYGTPWHGECDSVAARGVPLEKIFFLHHDEQNRARSLKGVAAASALLPRCFLPMWDEAGMRFTAQFSAEVALGVPCYDLGFVPDSKVLDFVRCVQ